MHVNTGPRTYAALHPAGYLIETIMIFVENLCRSIDVKQHNGMIATTWEVIKPGGPAEEVELKVFLCRQCGRTFNEMEGRGEERKEERP